MNYRLITGDALTELRKLPEESVQCCITSPPYWGLRDYGIGGQIGLERTPEEYVEKIVDVFREVRRVLRSNGIFWLNMGDSYFGGGRGGNPDDSPFRKQATNRGSLVAPTCLPRGCKPKDLVGIPWMLAFALRADGWWLRSDIIWSKPNPMPESVTDRPTRAHEYLFLLSKSRAYFYDAAAIAEHGVSAGTTKMPDGWNTAPGAHGSFHPQGREKGKPADRHGSTLQGGDYGRHFLGDAIPPKERRTDKQRGHSRRHAGFNDRWDAMEREEQCQWRNKRSVWIVATQPFPEAHFATFPEDLIEPCVLAGTSPTACGVCGAPWERVLERKHYGDLSPRSIGLDESVVGASRNNFGGQQRWSEYEHPRTTGWAPTCDHNDNTGRCTILDPFSGAGTTGVVALAHQRSYIGVEINPQYNEMAGQRLAQVAPLFAKAVYESGGVDSDTPGSVGPSSERVGGDGRQQQACAPIEPRTRRNTASTRLEPVDGRTDDGRDRFAGESAPTADDSLAGAIPAHSQPTEEGTARNAGNTPLSEKEICVCGHSRDQHCATQPYCDCGQCWAQVGEEEDRSDWFCACTSFMTQQESTGR